MPKKKIFCLLEGNESKKVAESARGYAQMIQEHIFKEDNILYPMADEALSAEIQQCLCVVEEFEKRR